MNLSLTKVVEKVQKEAIFIERVFLSKMGHLFLVCYIEYL